MELAEPEP